MNVPSLPVLLLSYLECDLNLGPCPVCASVHTAGLKRLLWSFPCMERKSIAKRVFPAGIAQLWLMPCHFQPLNPKLPLGAGDPLLGQQNLSGDGKHRDDLSHRDSFLQKRQE